MKIKIISPTNDESCFEYEVIVDDISLSGFLTYEFFPQKSTYRNLLILSESNVLISNEIKHNYGFFKETLKSNINRGKFIGIKSVVNQIVDGSLCIDDVKIAIHKFGPVPVYILPGIHSLTFKGKEVNVFLGVYPCLPNRNTNKNNRKLYATPTFINSKQEYLECLDLGLGFLFKRYFEDIAEDMVDIENHLSNTKVFERAKAIEMTLAGSIKQKIDTVMPSLAEWEKYINKDYFYCSQIKECEIFEKTADWLYLASYSRIFSLYFINELYKHIGLSSQSNKYLDRFKSMEDVFKKLLGEENLHLVKQNLNQYNDLSKALHFYINKQYIDLQNLKNNTKTWTDQIIDFAKFVSLLNEYNIFNSRGRIFISYHHNVFKTKIVKNQIENYIKEIFDDNIEILYCNSRKTRRDFIKEIKGKIWLADIVEGIFPADTTEISHLQQEKDYIWIAMEAEHGLLLDKDLIYILEEGTDVKKVINDIKSDRMGFLSPNARQNPEERINNLISSITNYNFTEFTVNDLDESSNFLDPRVKDLIKEEVKTSISVRIEKMVIGLIHQLPIEICETLCDIYKIAKYDSLERHPKTWYIKKLRETNPSRYYSDQKAEKLFDNCWELLKNRTIIVKGKDIRLIEIFSRRYYSPMIDVILRDFLPVNMNKIDILEWTKRIINNVENDLMSSY